MKRIFPDIEGRGFLFADAIGPAELDTLSQALARGIEALHEPDAVVR